MTVKEILLNTCLMLGLDASIVSEPSSDEKSRDLLLSALNFVLFEISEQIPTYYKESLVSTDKLIPYTAFTKHLSIIKKVQKNGVKAKYLRGERGLIVEQDGVYEIEYAYTPDNVSIDDEVVLPPSVSIRTVSYGVCGEYALYVGRFDECETYDSRFINALVSAKRSGVREWRGGKSVL